MATIPGSNQQITVDNNTTAASTVVAAANNLLGNILGSNVTGVTTTVTTLSGGSQVVLQDRPGSGTTNVAVTASTVTQTVTLPTVSGSAAVTVQLPANVAVITGNTELPTVSSTATQAQVVQTFSTSVMNEVLSIVGSQLGTPGNVTISGATSVLVNSINESVQAVFNAFIPTGPSTNFFRPFDDVVMVSPMSIEFGSSLRVSALTDGSDTISGGADSVVGANEILLSTPTSASKELFVVNLSLAKNATVVLQNIEAAVLAAPGVVRNEGNAPIMITSDLQAQAVTGGGGNDTLVGTGNDTLTGGAGNDIFGIKGAGKYTITDFNKAGDMLAFQMDGVTNLTQLKAKVTSVVTGTSSVTFNFGADTSITLVGVTAADLTASMIKFSITG